MHFFSAACAPLVILLCQVHTVQRTHQGEYKVLYCSIIVPQNMIPSNYFPSLHFTQSKRSRFLYPNKCHVSLNPTKVIHQLRYPCYVGKEGLLNRKACPSTVTLKSDSLKEQTGFDLFITNKINLINLGHNS